MLSLTQQKQDEATPGVKVATGAWILAALRGRVAPALLAHVGTSKTSPLLIPHLTVPVPSGVDLTKVGSIFTEAVGLVSAPSPFSISFPKRCDTSWRVSSERRMS